MQTDARDRGGVEMIRIEIEQRPEGWTYEWAEYAEGATEAEAWQGTTETFDSCLDKLYDSIRERLPVGKLQGDELLVSVAEQKKNDDDNQNQDGVEQDQRSIAPDAKA